MHGLTDLCLFIAGFAAALAYGQDASRLVAALVRRARR